MCAVLTSPIARYKQDSPNETLADNWDKDARTAVHVNEFRVTQEQRKLCDADATKNWGEH